MKLKTLWVVAAVLLVAACHQQAPESAAPGPAPAPAPSGPVGVDALRQQLVQVGDRVFFGFNRSDITPEAQQILSRQAQLLQANPSISITIAGNCDERGTREYNLGLGERRANAAKQALVALGVNPARITTISYGKERPSVPGHNEQAWAQNRNAITTIN
ncbi:MAG TPA: peptidoglycan-associated lipoprotein Pal [Stellaceae bacterium]|nr:peptidoglycan-associated lipoprotein Pal [Stellaceae bacterium]